jgi:hypothetical protein
MTFGNHPDTGEKCCPRCHSTDLKANDTIVGCNEDDCDWWDYL